MIPCNDIKRFYNKHQLEFEEAAIRALRSGWYILGQEGKQFEQEFALSIGGKYCVAVDNATNALFLGIKALGIGPGDEVLVQANTYIATVLGITRNGATPIFVEPNEYYNMNDNIEEFITSRTKAVLVTHLFGQATNMDRIISCCKAHNLYLLEDCSQAHYAKYNDKYVGTVGIMGFFSFYPTKNIGAFGDAGAIVTNDENLAIKLQMIRNYGSRARYDFVYDGINSRMDEIQAALLRVKLKYKDDINNERTYIANRYLKEIKNPLVELPKIADNCTTVWHLFVLRVNDRDKFMNYMKEKGISTDIHYPTPPYLSECYRCLGHKVGEYPITDNYSKVMVDIPLFNGMSDSEISAVVEAINGYRG